MYNYKLYQLVLVQEEGYHFIGQIISHPINEKEIMVRRVPDDPATLERMNMEKLRPATQKYKWVHYAVISGKFSFPTDMLRYDMAAPVNFRIIENERGIEHPEFTTKDYGNELIIATVSDKKTERWTYERWRSFIWNIRPLKSIKIENK